MAANILTKILKKTQYPISLSSGDQADRDVNRNPAKLNIYARILLIQQYSTIISCICV